MSRLGFVGPFPPTGVIAPDVPITLQSGGTMTLPKGNWIVSPGTNTRLQFMDPVNFQWRSTQGPLGGGYISSDGTNYRLLNVTGTVTAIAVTAAGSGATNGIGYAQTGVAVSIAASTWGPAYSASAYAIVGGSVNAPTMVQPGSGFLAPPLIVCDPPPPGGVQATAVATVTGNQINSITMDNPGAGYLTPPQWYVFPEPVNYYGAYIAGVAPDNWPAPGRIHPSMLPPGSMYQANIDPNGVLFTSTALTGSGTVTAVMIMDPGGGYLTGTPPAVTITGAGAATATSTVSTAAATDRSFLQSRVQ